MTSQNNTVRCAASVRYSTAGPNMPNGDTRELLALGEDDVRDWGRTRRSPFRACQVNSSWRKTPRACLSFARELRPKIDAGFDIGQRTRTLLRVGFVLCLRQTRQISRHS